MPQANICTKMWIHSVTSCAQGQQPSLNVSGRKGCEHTIGSGDMDSPSGMFSSWCSCARTAETNKARVAAYPRPLRPTCRSEADVYMIALCFAQTSLVSKLHRYACVRMRLSIRSALDREHPEEIMSMQRIGWKMFKRRSNLTQTKSGQTDDDDDDDDDHADSKLFADTSLASCRAEPLPLSATSEITSSYLRSLTSHPN